MVTGIEGASQLPQKPVAPARVPDGRPAVIVPNGRPSPATTQTVSTVKAADAAAFPKEIQDELQKLPAFDRTQIEILLKATKLEDAEKLVWVTALKYYSGISVGQRLKAYQFSAQTATPLHYVLFYLKYSDMLRDARKKDPKAKIEDLITDRMELARYSSMEQNLMTNQGLIQTLESETIDRLLALCASPSITIGDKAIATTDGIKKYSERILLLKKKIDEHLKTGFDKAYKTALDNLTKDTRDIVEAIKDAILGDKPFSTMSLDELTYEKIRATLDGDLYKDELISWFVKFVAQVKSEVLDESEEYNILLNCLYSDEIRPSYEAIRAALISVPQNMWTNKNLDPNFYATGATYVTVLKARGMYQPVLIAYKREKVLPAVQRAHEVLRSHSMIGTKDTTTTTIVAPLVELLKLAYDKTQSKGRIKVTRLCFLIKNRAELNPKPDGSKSDIVRMAESSAAAMGLSEGSIEYLVAPGVIKSSSGNGAAEEKTLVAVEVACDTTDPDDFVINTAWKQFSTVLYSAMFPWKNTEERDPSELALGSAFSTMILGEKPAGGEPGSVGYIDRVPAKYGERLIHVEEHKLFSLSKAELSYILGLVLTKTKVDLRPEMEQLWKIIAQAKEKSASESDFDAQLDLVLKEIKASDHINNAFKLIAGSLSDEIPVYEDREVGILPSVIGSVRYEKFQTDTLIERIRLMNTTAESGRHLTDQDFAAVDKLREDAEKRDYESMFKSNTAIRTIKTPVGKPSVIKEFIPADIMKRAFFSYWRDRVSSPRYSSPDLCKMLNELSENGLGVSDEEVFGFDKGDWNKRLEALLFKTRFGSGEKPDEAQKKQLATDAQRMGNAIYEMIFSAKIQALKFYQSADSLEMDALTRIKAAVIK